MNSKFKANAIQYQLIGTPIVRSATEPVESYPSDLPSDDKETLDRLLSNRSNSFMVSLGIASRDLSDSIQRFHNGSKIRYRKTIRGLLKYIIRASTRSTPFGGFSEIGTLSSVNRQNDGELILLRSKDRFTVCVSGEKPQTVSLNPSLFSLGNRLFIPTPSRNAEESSVRFTRPLSSIIKIFSEKSACRKNELRNLLASSYDVSAEVIQQFIDELIKTGVLLDAEPERTFITIPRAESEHILQYETSPHVVNSFADYAGNIPEWMAQNTGEALTVLGNLFAPASIIPCIKKHALKYEERFGMFRQPIAYAFDSYLGIGLPDFQDKGSEKEVDRSLGTTKALLAKIIQSSLSEKKTSIDLADLTPELKQPQRHFASSYEAILHVEKDQNGQSVLGLDPVGTILHAGRGLGRFAAYDNSICETYRKLVHFDVAHSLVPLCGLSYTYSLQKANNVNGDATEYPLHLNMNIPNDNNSSTINFKDVSVFVENGCFHLYDEKRQTILDIRDTGVVNPDLGNSWVRFMLYNANYDTATPFWSWLDFPQIFPHLPEVRWKNVILAREQWHVDDGVNDIASLEQWSRSNQVPDHVLVGSEDNQLLLNIRDNRHKNLLLRELGVGNRTLFSAPPPSKYGSCVDSAGLHYSTEIQLSLTSDAWLSNRRNIPIVPPKGLKVDYSEQPTGLNSWINLILFCRPQLEEDVIHRFSSFLEMRHQQFYFVRYSDQGNSIRLRIRAGHLSPQNGITLSLVDELIGNLITERLVTSYSITLWHPEFSRYGGLEGFALASDIFILETKWLWSDSALKSDERCNRVYCFAMKVAAWAFNSQLVSTIANSLEAEFPDERNLIRSKARSMDLIPTGNEPSMGSENLCKLYKSHFTRFHDPLAIQSMLHMMFNRTGLDRKEEAIFYRMLSNRRQHEQHRHG